MSQSRLAPRACVVLASIAVHVTLAHAQSAVTLYGALDTSIEITNPGAGYVARMDSGAYRGSRIGLRGAEDVGHDIKIMFNLENGFSSADGSFAVANTVFNRQAWIGLGTLYGTVRIGRQYSPVYIPFKGQLDAFDAGTIASGLDNLSRITPYESNAITYLSPEFPGFSTTIMASLRESGGGNGNGGTPPYHNDGVSVSARYALNTRFRASLGYTYLRDRSGGDNNADQLSAACEYDVSKRALLYASAGWLRNRGQGEFTLKGVNVTGLAPSWPGATVRGVQLGMIDRF